MPFLGLVWIASCWTCFLTSSQGLLKAPDSLFNTSPAKGWSFFGSPGSPVEKSPSFFRQAAVNSSFLPSSHLPAVWMPLNKMLNWGRSHPPSNSLQPFVRSLGWLNPLDNLLGTTPPLLGGEAIRLVQPAPLLGTGSPITFTEQADRDGAANKIVRFFQNLLPKPRHSEPDSSEPISVVIVRPDQHSQVETGQAKLGYRKLLGFWQKSAIQARSASVASSKKGGFQVWVKGYLIAEMPDRERAKSMASHLERFLKQPGWQASQLQPSLVNGMPAIKAGDGVLLAIDEELAVRQNRSRDVVAIEWLNNLRIALGTTPLTLVEAQTQMYGLAETGGKIEGPASWYGPYFHGRLTATGETFNQNDLTAAHPSLPFDTYLKVTNLKNGKQVIVRVNDRGPYVDDRILDLSREAARCLNSLDAGVVPIEAVLMKPTSGQTPPVLHQPVTGL